MATDLTKPLDFIASGVFSEKGPAFRKFFPMTSPPLLCLGVLSMFWFVKAVPYLPLRLCLDIVMEFLFMRAIRMYMCPLAVTPPPLGLALLTFLLMEVITSPSSFLGIYVHVRARTRRRRDRGGVGLWLIITSSPPPTSTTLSLSLVFTIYLPFPRGSDCPHHQ